MLFNVLYLNADPIQVGRILEVNSNHYINLVLNMCILLYFFKCLD